MRKLLAFWLCLLAMPCDAAIYQWTDDHGTVQFSDQAPPPGIKAIERHDVEASVAAAPPVPPSVARSAPRPERQHPPRRRTSGITERERARQRCDKLRHRIATTQSQLRAGYNARRGIVLADRLRADRDKLHHECRY